jgi:hypothetical protein
MYDTHADAAFLTWQALRTELSASGEVRRVPYACNRAVIFVSDQYAARSRSTYDLGAMYL